MGKVLLVTSGKGGTGKSTVAVNLSTALSKEEKSSIIIELDCGLRCLDLMLGIDDIVYDLGDVLSGNCEASQAVYKSANDGNVYLVAAPFDAGFSISGARLSRLCDYFRKGFDYVILDAPAGLGYSVKAAASAVDGAIIVTGISDISVRDAEKTADELVKLNVKYSRLVINRVPLEISENETITDFDDIIDKIGVRLIAVIPEDPVLRIESNKISPKAAKKSLGLCAFSNMAKRMLGQDVPLLIK